MAFTVYLILAVLVLVISLAGYFYSTSKLSLLRIEREVHEAREAAEQAAPRTQPSPRTSAMIAVVTRGYDNLPVGTMLIRTASGRWTVRGSSSDNSLSDADIRRLQEIGVLSPIEANPDILASGVAMPGDFQRLNEEFRRASEVLQGDFQRMSEDFRRAFDTQLLLNTRHRPSPPKPAPAPPPVPKTPPKPVPKSAMERLLEKDLIPDEDPGVKPRS